MITQNLHMHSTWDDGKSSIEEMILASKAAGLTSVGVSLHAPLPYGSEWGAKESDLPAYIAEVRALKEKYAEQIDVYLGIEWDAISETDLAPYDYVIGSVHHLPYEKEDVPAYFPPEFRWVYPTVDESAEATRRLLSGRFGGDSDAMAEAFFAEYDKVAANERAQIVGHFDLLTKFDEQCGFFNPRGARYQKAARSAMEKLVAAGKIFEVNTGAISRGYRTTPYPSAELLCLLREMGGKVTVSADAHHTSGAACAFDKAEQLIKACGFEEIWVLEKQGFVPQKLK